MSDQETLRIYDAEAETYAKLTANTGGHVDLTTFIESLPQGARVLDLGCGPGLNAAVMAQAGLVVEATDASGEMVRLANAQKGVTARLETFDALDADTAYDGVFANFSLLHAERSQVPTHIAQIARALKTGGLFHIGMKTGTGQSRDAIGRRYSYFTQAELEDMLAAQHLTVVYRNHGCDMGLSGEMADWVSLQARKES